MKIRKNEGFTLLELLVVISIIGILIAMGAVAYSAAQKKGRNAKRIGDMKAEQAIFEQYYAINGHYDNCNLMASSSVYSLPVEIKSGNPPYTCSADQATYGACAFLECNTGFDCNQGNYFNGAYVNSGLSRNSFCINNLQ